jgi:hypothetical protein
MCYCVCVFYFQKTILSLENPSKFILTPKNTKPFLEILKNLKFCARLVFALFWLLIAILLELIAIELFFIFFYAFLGAAGAGELIPEYDYADDFAMEDYQAPGSRPTDFENL